MKGTSSTVWVKQLCRHNKLTTYFRPFYSFVFCIITNSSNSAPPHPSLYQLQLSVQPLPIPSPPPSCLLGLENETFGQVVLAVGDHTPRSHVHDECPYVSEPYIDVFTGYFRMLEAFKYSVSEGG